MYMIAIGWMYVVLMASIANPNPVGGVLTFFFAGLGPLALFLWLFGTPARRRAKARRETEEAAVLAQPESFSNQINEAKRPVTPSRR
ncbi:MAG TPA: hypothetical protein VKY38_06740 [Azoarcus sp.]|nr:hypothetical protein [Azoarcus sp.]